MDYEALLEDLYAMAQKAGDLADGLWYTAPQRSIELSIFYRDCFEFYHDICDPVNAK